MTRHMFFFVSAAEVMNRRNRVFDDTLAHAPTHQLSFGGCYFVTESGGGAAALQDAGALTKATMSPPGFGVRRPSAAFETRDRIETDQKVAERPHSETSRISPGWSRSSASV